MSCPIDISGKIYNRLTAVKFLHMNKESAIWLFRCSCGKEKVSRAWAVKSGATKSCGCIRHEPRPWKQIHGKSHTTIWIRYQHMKTRCNKPDNPAYANYGGRGIKISKEWKTFKAFYRDMGDPPSRSHSIDRINNDGPYSKENCRWATKSEQALNRRTARMINFKGKTQNMFLWAKEIGLKPKTLHLRLAKGWSIERALTQPHRLVCKGSMKLEDAQTEIVQYE